jgi:hypothetical protein
MANTFLNQRGPTREEFEQARRYSERCVIERKAMTDDEYIRMKMNERRAGGDYTALPDEDPWLYIAAVIALVCVGCLWLIF